MAGATVSPGDIVAQMINALAITEPDLDTSIGTPVRKILDAVGEVVAEGYADSHLLDYQYDIETKVGADLDDFVSLFGFTRFAPKRAVGVVTFQRDTAATSDILIPIGTQVATDDTIPVVVGTVVPALLVQGDTSIDVPVQALVGGAQGNISANAITRRVTPFDGISAFTNPTALSGGADSESDDQLRDRFKRTVFRNMAGTEAMFLAIALDNESVTQANVVGATSVRREQIELIGHVGTSTLEKARFIYPKATFGPSIDDGLILTPDVQYQFLDTVPPQVISLDSASVPDGVYELEFEYVSDASRNDPNSGIRNRVDVYVNGILPEEATETTIVQVARVFNTTSGDPLNVANFERPTGDQPTPGNIFIPFAFTPVLDPSVNDNIIINSVTYVEGTDYYLINDITREGGTPESLSGIELIVGGAQPTPPDASLVNLDYTFNTVPRDVEQAVAAWRLVTTDVRVHQARQVLLTVNLAFIFKPGYNAQATYDLVSAAIRAYFASVNFAGAVQISDILEAVGAVTGVDAVRFLTDADGYIPPTEADVVWALQRVNSLGTVLETYDNGGTPKRAIDVLLDDDQIPILNKVNFSVKAQNSWGAV